MNKDQRKVLAGLTEQLVEFSDEDGLKDFLTPESRHEISGKIEDITSEITSVKSEEEEKFENLSPGAQDGARGEALQEGISFLQSAVDALEDASSTDFKAEDWAVTVAGKVSEAMDALNDV